MSIQHIHFTKWIICISAPYIDNIIKIKGSVHKKRIVMCRMLGFIMFWIAVGMIIGLIFTGSMFWHIVIIIALIIIGYNMFCH